jgi:ABC-type transporter Mla subunit MlaD
MFDQVEQTTPDDNLARLEAALPKLAPALEQKHLGIALSQAQTALKPFEPQLRQLDALTDAAALLWEYLDLNRRDLEDIADELDELASEMEEASTQYELNGITKTFPNTASKHIPRYNRTVHAMVRRYSAKELSSLGALGRLLVKIGQSEIGHKLQKLETDAKRLEQTSPSALAEGIRAIQAQKTTTQAEVTALAKEPEVDVFLSALSRSQCSLGHVTPKVLEWLDRLGAREQFRVLSA